MLIARKVEREEESIRDPEKVEFKHVEEVDEEDEDLEDDF